MPDLVIQADHLGKKYTIGHQAENGRYTALRDVLLQNARSLWHKTRDLVQGKPIVQGDTLEEVWALKDVSFEIRRGEVVGQACPRWLIVRAASLFGKAGARGKGGNFVETILARARAGESLQVVDDIRMSPTYTRDAAWVLELLMRHRASGLVHLTNAGACTWYEFACKAVQLVGLPTDVAPITAEAYPSTARRPRDASMQSLCLEEMLEHPMRSWQEALHAYLVEQGHVEDGERA